MEDTELALTAPEDVDRALAWKPGRAERLARRGILPHIVLPDGEIRFDLREVQALLKHVKADRKLRVVRPPKGGAA
jgi:hypothetical protein